MEISQLISSIGTLIGDPTRAIILASLLDGRAWTAGELAIATGVTPQTMSSHLSKLVQNGLLERTSQGRHRYFKLASPEVANMLENLTAMTLYRAQKKHITKLKNTVRVPKDLRQARTCYDHLAGQLGVTISEAMIKKKILNYGDTDFIVTAKGTKFFDDLGINCEELQLKKRRFAHQCLDWSEHKYHIAGLLGAALYTKFNDQKWIHRTPNSRAVKLTRVGKSNLISLLDI